MTVVTVDAKLKELFKSVLDICPEEIQPVEPLDTSLDIDSTELVELTVAIKKEFNISLAGGDLKKTQSFQDIVDVVTSKQG